MYSHRGAWVNALGELIESQMSVETRYLWTLPMFHCNGWCFTWGVTAVAGTHICLRRVEPGRVWEMIDREGVSHYNGAPTVHIGVVNDPKAHTLARPVTVCVAGAPPSPTLLGRLRELGFRPVHVYGHTDGYVELRDRKKDIIISGGENISTIEVEQAVARHPAVLECAVVAVPDDKWGERPKAFVTLKPGQTASAGEIIEFCRKHIAHFKCPAAVEFGDLPKTSTGKVQKFVLREREWKGKEKRIN